VNQQDRQDIDDARNGNHEAFRRLVERYEADISRLMWRFTQSDQVCEELVQEAFVEAYFSLDSYRYKAPFLFWLKTIATRVGYRLWKRQAKERQFVQIDYVADIEAPERRDNSDDLNRIVNDLLAQLSPADRMVLTLLYFEKCSVRDIAEHMGWNQALVKTRAYRARKKLLGIANRMQIWDELEWIT
jgi:RNA polymerase sigma-70 factor (ECF subfamily)